jgi:cell division protein FtsW
LPSKIVRMAAAKRSRRRAKPPLEYSILYTATLCLLAAGAVMVYSASSAESLIQNGDPAFFLKRYAMFGALGLIAMHAISRGGLRVVKKATPVLLGISFVLTVAVMLPGIGITVNGATRWLGAGPVQFQPSELLKVSLTLYSAGLLASRPKCLRSVKELCRPLLVVVGAACLLLLKQPDMGTAMVICLSTFALLVAAGARMRHLGTILVALAAVAMVFALAAPYRRDRLLSFVDPWHDAAGIGFQAAQAQIALGSGGMFGVGLGESVQKNFYLPEAHTDMILAIVGEELGVMGVAALAALYGLIAYAGFRAAKLARDRYPKLLAAGLTALILTQAALNFFAVLGMAPLTGVPLPFVSYGSSNLVVLLGAMGLVLNVAATGGRSAARGRGRLEAIDGGSDADSDRRRRDGGARRARAGNRRRAAG